MEARVGAITLFVDDPRRSNEFYAHVWDATPVYEDAVSVAFRFDATVVNLLARSEAHELVAPAPVAGAGAGSQLQLTVWVADADAACAELAAKGVGLLNGPLDRPWGLRTAAFADPDGYVWEIAQSIEAG